MLPNIEDWGAEGGWRRVQVFDELRSEFDARRALMQDSFHQPLGILILCDDMKSWYKLFARVALPCCLSALGALSVIAAKMWSKMSSQELAWVKKIYVEGCECSDIIESLCRGHTTITRHMA